MGAAADGPEQPDAEQPDAEQPDHRHHHHAEQPDDAEQPDAEDIELLLQDESRTPHLTLTLALTLTQTPPLSRCCRMRVAPHTWL